MHYTGMAAFEIAGRIVSGFAAGCGSIALGAFFWGRCDLCRPAQGFPDRESPWRRFADRRDLRSSFTAWAPHARPGSRIAVSDAALPAAWLAVAVALASFAILVASQPPALPVDFRDRRTRRSRGHHMRGARQLPLSRGSSGSCRRRDRSVAANEAFTRLSGMDADKVLTTSLATVFPDEDIRPGFFNRAERMVEASLVHTGRRADPRGAWSFLPIIFAKTSPRDCQCAICGCERASRRHTFRHLARS